MRTLTLCTKVIQSLANLTLFKEPHMLIFNGIITKHLHGMQTFLERASSPLTSTSSQVSATIPREGGVSERTAIQGLYTFFLAAKGDIAGSTQAANSEAVWDTVDRLENVHIRYMSDHNSPLPQPTAPPRIMSLSASNHVSESEGEYSSDSTSRSMKRLGFSHNQ
jgi:hypothetical protein